MGEREVEEDTHKLVRQEVFEGEKCYVVESIPKEKDYMYTKKLFWVVEGEWLVPKAEYYDRKGRFLKELQVKWQKVQDIWAWQDISMKNVQTGHYTLIEIRDVTFNQGIPEEYFTQRTLIREGK
jgi:outer membrane lipoprotein-sorting protein